MNLSNVDLPWATKKFVFHVTFSKSVSRGKCFSVSATDIIDKV